MYDSENGKSYARETIWYGDFEPFLPHSQGPSQVNVSVNGQQIPFKMKIGEAGEAFFVFEIEGDVPEDLITSPILQPTRPDDDVEGPTLDAKEDQETLSSGAEKNPLADKLAAQEPEFLDLNALPSPPPEDPLTKAGYTPESTFIHPPLVQKLPQVPDTLAQFLPSPPLIPTELPFILPSEAEQDLRVDEALKLIKDNLDTPKVEYHKGRCHASSFVVLSLYLGSGIALDAEGYHSHVRERSDSTVRPSNQQPFPSGSQPSCVAPAHHCLSTDHSPFSRTRGPVHL